MIQARRGLDEAHRAALRPCTEKRTLRTAQHFHALEIEQCREGIAGAVREIAHLDRRVVDVDTGRASACSR